MTVYTKICGITRLCDAITAIDSGVSALGFIAFPPSPRNITSNEFSKLVEKIKEYKNSVEIVVVMVNPTKEKIDEYLLAGADIIQLHGKESPDFVNSLKCRCWKAFNINSKEKIKQLNEYKVEKFLIDSFVKDAKVPGGTGHIADWELSKIAVKELSSPVLLAGGIKSENIENAWEIVKPFGFDISSGVEDSPGIKSEQKIKELFNKIQKIN